jgi:quinol monooxygenase YgiN
LIIRSWRTAIDFERVEEFEAFARSYSLPMFQQQQGCIGVLFALTGADSTTFSFWEDREAIDRLTSSPSYQETVNRIQETGFLRGEPEVRIFPVFGGHLDLEAIGRTLR